MTGSRAQPRLTGSRFSAGDRIYHVKDGRVSDGDEPIQPLDTRAPESQPNPRKETNA